MRSLQRGRHGTCRSDALSPSAQPGRAVSQPSPPRRTQHGSVPTCGRNLYEVGSPIAKPMPCHPGNLGRDQEPTRGICQASQYRARASASEQRYSAAPRARGKHRTSAKRTIGARAWRTVGRPNGGHDKRKPSNDGNHGRPRLGPKPNKAKHALAVMLGRVACALCFERVRKCCASNGNGWSIHPMNRVYSAS